MTTRNISHPDKASLPENVVGALDKIVGHFWSDEQSHYQQATPAEQTDHIFNALSLVNNWRAMAKRLNL